MTEYYQIGMLITELSVHSFSEPHGSSPAVSDTDSESFQVHYYILWQYLTQLITVHVAQDRLERSKALEVSYNIRVGEIA